MQKSVISTITDSYKIAKMFWKALSAKDFQSWTKLGL